MNGSATPQALQAIRNAIINTSKEIIVIIKYHNFGQLAQKPYVMTV